jgi:hypothetical protein
LGEQARKLMSKEELHRSPELSVAFAAATDNLFGTAPYRAIAAGAGLVDQLVGRSAKPLIGTSRSVGARFEPDGHHEAIPAPARSPSTTAA